jgi:hypothetical protein
VRNLAILLSGFGSGSVYIGREVIDLGADQKVLLDKLNGKFLGLGLNFPGAAVVRKHHPAQCEPVFFPG